MNNQTLQLYDYHRWANKRIVNHLKKLPAEVYDREIKSVFSSIREVIIHVYQTDGMWLSVMGGDSLGETMDKISQLREKSTGRDIYDMQYLYSKMTEQYKAFFDEQRDFEKIIEIEHPKFGKMKTAVSAMVTHVVNHGTYHRGNISAMLRQQGHEGVPTDYIFYLYEID